MAALKKGNPHDEETFIGPIIALKEAERIESWVKEAMDKGAGSSAIAVKLHGEALCVRAPVPFARLGGFQCTRLCHPPAALCYRCDSCVTLSLG